MKTYRYIDLDDMEKIEPSQKTGILKKPYITVDKKAIKLHTVAVELAPEQHRKPGKVNLYLSRDRKMLVIRPGENGGHNLRPLFKTAMICSAKAVSRKVREAGIVIPVRLAAEWDEFHGAWVGRMA